MNAKIQNKAAMEEDDYFFPESRSNPSRSEKSAASRETAAPREKEEHPRQARRSLPFLPPHVVDELSQIGRDLRQNWLTLLLVTGLSSSGCASLIYADYQQERDRQLVLSSYRGCLKSLKKYSLDDAKLNEMGLLGGEKSSLPIPEVQSLAEHCQAQLWEISAATPEEGWTPTTINLFLQDKKKPVRHAATKPIASAPALPMTMEPAPTPEKQIVQPMHAGAWSNGRG